ncbi:hypothetical protein B0H21DRAFT_709908 [Amylocystis lapponica]|nr:hypothetical protein B0H21DRAFT_709908 [Amylocystis lapponica]
MLAWPLRLPKGHVHKVIPPPAPICGFQGPAEDRKAPLVAYALKPILRKPTAACQFLPENEGLVETLPSDIPAPVLRTWIGLAIVTEVSAQVFWIQVGRTNVIALSLLYSNSTYRSFFGKELLYQRRINIRNSTTTFSRMLLTADEIASQCDHPMVIVMVLDIGGEIAYRWLKPTIVVMHVTTVTTLSHISIFTWTSFRDTEQYSADTNCSSQVCYSGDSRGSPSLLEFKLSEQTLLRRQFRPKVQTTLLLLRIHRNGLHLQTCHCPDNLVSALCSEVVPTVVERPTQLLIYAGYCKSGGYGLAVHQGDFMHDADLRYEHLGHCLASRHQNRCLAMTFALRGSRHSFGAATASSTQASPSASPLGIPKDNAEEAGQQGRTVIGRGLLGLLDTWPRPVVVSRRAARCFIDGHTDIIAGTRLIVTGRTEWCKCRGGPAGVSRTTYVFRTSHEACKGQGRGEGSLCEIYRRWNLVRSDQASSPPKDKTASEVQGVRLMRNIAPRTTVVPRRYRIGPPMTRDAFYVLARVVNVSTRTAYGCGHIDGVAMMAAAEERDLPASGRLVLGGQRARREAGEGIT